MRGTIAALVPGGIASAMSMASAPATALVSVSLDGTPAGGLSGEPSVSADGRYVAFTSSAVNLVAGDTNRATDVFVRDRGTATTSRASVADDGTETNHGSYTPSISADGRHVAFQSYATNRAPGSEEWHPNVYMRDLAG